MQVLTADGFKKFHGVRKTEAKSLISFTLQNGVNLKCTPEHNIVKFNMGMIPAKDFKVNDAFEDQNGNPIKIVHIENVDVSKDGAAVYDLLNVGEKHEYIANGIRLSNCLIMDEAAFIPPTVASDFFASVYPIVSTDPNSTVIMVSTPNGTANNLYYDIWKEANQSDENDKDAWFPFRMDWWDVPGRDEAWKANQIKSIGRDRFRVEFGNEFTSTKSTNLIPDDVIENHRMKLDELNQKKAQVDFSYDSSEKWAYIWENYNPMRTYLASTDVSEGNGGDASVTQIYDITYPKQDGIKMVASLVSNSSGITEYAFMVNELLKLYGQPVYVIEGNGVGGGFIDLMRNTYQYPNMVTWLNSKGEIMYGLKSDNKKKLEACMFAREMMTTPELKFILPDKGLLNEMATFVKRTTSSLGNATYAAQSGSHDDLIMTFIWAMYMISPNMISDNFIVEKAFETNLGRVFPEVIRPLNSPSFNVPKAIRESAVFQNIEVQLNGLQSDFQKVDHGTGTIQYGKRGIDQQVDFMGISNYGGTRSLYGNKPFMTINGNSYSSDDEEDWNWNGVDGLWDG